MLYIDELSNRCYMPSRMQMPATKAKIPTHKAGTVSAGVNAITPTIII